LDEITAHLVGFSRSRREPAGAKYYKLSKTELQQELKKLQKELLPVEREVNGPYLALRKAQQDYQSASEEQKFDALLRFLEARAALRKPQFRQQELRYHEIQNEFQAAQEAYVKLLEQ
jgi:hypothetical protein